MDDGKEALIVAGVISWSVCSVLGLVLWIVGVI